MMIVLRMAVGKVGLKRSSQKFSCATVSVTGSLRLTRNVDGTTPFTLFAEDKATILETEHSSGDPNSVYQDLFALYLERHSLFGGRFFSIYKQDNKVGFSRFFIHDMQSVYMNFPAFQRLESGTASHRPSGHYGGFFISAQILAGKEDGGVTAGDGNFLLDDATQSLRSCIRACFGSFLRVPPVFSSPNNNPSAGTV